MRAPHRSSHSLSPLATFRILAIVALAGGAFSPTISRAEGLGARLDVTATVVPDCRLSVPPLAFGTYDPVAVNAIRPADASSIITVSCTRNMGAVVSMDFGLYAAGGFDRALSGGNRQLRYQLYRDSGRSLIWGRGADAVKVQSTGATTPNQLTVFGRIAGGQEAEPGSYSDQITATVDF